MLMEAFVKRKGRELQKKFISLGDMRGMDYKDIESVVGKPNSISNMADGSVLKQWIVTGYHIAIIFDKDDKMVSISHETVV